MLVDLVSPATPYGRRPYNEPVSPLYSQGTDDELEQENTSTLQRWTYSARFSEGPDAPTTSYRLIWYVDPTRRHELHPVSSVSVLQSISVPWHKYRRWNGECYSPTAVPPSTIHASPRRLAPKQSQPRSPLSALSTARSSWPLSRGSGSGDVPPTLPPFSHIFPLDIVHLEDVHLEDETQPGEAAGGNRYVLPPLRMPIREATNPVQGVGYRESAWRRPDAPLRPRSE
ncbi:hypothetical protein CALVIDRAFT_541528 [Calocera viscosa TUFC12733]|uniref:Uncharacterized protein n=1 Tax=Calocera viscosa (strain TUFC12733) TaxID=1330018 RepID=A0A167HM54_CALVF|nr:hypothetical protein CALVIDRAFT_541528 [Calocera viscosa TUFC12733]